MKKHSRVVFFMAASLAGFIGQMAAFGQTTNASYTLQSIITIKAGKFKTNLTYSATAVFLSNSNCFLNIDDLVLSGTYTLSKNGKQATLNPDISADESTVISFIESKIPEITPTVKTIKFSKITRLSEGAPSTKTKATVTARGKYTESGSSKAKGYSFKAVAEEWTGSGAL